MYQINEPKLELKYLEYTGFPLNYGYFKDHLDKGNFKKEDHLLLVVPTESMEMFKSISFFDSECPLKNDFILRHRPELFARRLDIFLSTYTRRGEVVLLVPEDLLSETKKLKEGVMTVVADLIPVCKKHHVRICILGKKV